MNNNRTFVDILKQWASFTYTWDYEGKKKRYLTNWLVTVLLLVGSALAIWKMPGDVTYIVVASLVGLGFVYTLFRANWVGAYRSKMLLKVHELTKSSLELPHDNPSGIGMNWKGRKLQMLSVKGDRGSYFASSSSEFLVIADKLNEAFKLRKESFYIDLSLISDGVLRAVPVAVDSRDWSTYQEMLKVFRFAADNMREPGRKMPSIVGLTQSEILKGGENSFVFGKVTIEVPDAQFTTFNKDTIERYFSEIFNRESQGVVWLFTWEVNPSRLIIAEAEANSIDVQMIQATKIVSACVEDAVLKNLGYNPDDITVVSWKAGTPIPEMVRAGFIHPGLRDPGTRESIMIISNENLTYSFAGSVWQQQWRQEGSQAVLYLGNVAQVTVHMDASRADDVSSENADNYSDW